MTNTSAIGHIHLMDNPLPIHRQKAPPTNKPTVNRSTTCNPCRTKLHAPTQARKSMVQPITAKGLPCIKRCAYFPPATPKSNIFETTIILAPSN